MISPAGFILLSQQYNAASCRKTNLQAHAPKLIMRQKGIFPLCSSLQRPLQIVGKKVVVVYVIQRLRQKICQLAAIVLICEITKPIAQAFTNIDFRQFCPMDPRFVQFISYRSGFLWIRKFYDSLNIFLCRRTRRVLFHLWTGKKIPGIGYSAILKL